MLAELLDTVNEGMSTYDLSRPYTIGMPQSPFHPAFWHTLPRRHGDRVRADGGSSANDLIIMGTHVGTHVDAIDHISHNGKLYGGRDATQEQLGGRFDEFGIHALPPIVSRGLLLDVPAVLGLPACEPGYEITPDLLDATVEKQGANPRPGDVLLLRSGWGQRWDEGTRAYLGHDTGVPGPGEAAAHWLAAHQPRAVGADTIAFEYLAPGAGHAHLPAHRVLLAQRGINIIETLALEQLATNEVHQFMFVAAPLPLVGATGSPVRPLAIVDADN